MLKNNTWHTDAAFNYEYIVRLRDEVAKGKQPPQPPKDQSEESDNGESGAPSPATTTKGFQIYIPLEQGEKNPAGGEAGKAAREGTQGRDVRSFRAIDFETFRFARRCYLWLLVASGGAAGRLGLARRAPARRTCGGWRRGACCRCASASAPVGDLAFWAACSSPPALCIVALARPQARVSSFRKASADVVILQDASASMYVTDVRPDRWRRSVQFLGRSPRPSAGRAIASRWRSSRSSRRRRSG